MKAEWWSYLAIFLCVGAREQRMEDNDCLIQIPHKNPLQKEKQNNGRWFFRHVASIAWDGHSRVVLLSISCSSVVFLDSSEQRGRRSKGIPHIHWDLNGIYSQYCKCSVSGCFFFLPPGHYQEEGRGCSCGPCPGTWTPHSGRLGHPTLW